MSTRTTLRPQTVIPSAQASPASTGDMSADITSAPTILQSLTMVNYAVSWTGTSPVGTVSVEASNDCTVNAEGGVSGGTWNPLPLDLNGVTVTTIPVTGNTGNGMIDIDGLAAYAVRLKYTFTSGVGTLTVVVTGKVA